ncbi:nucleotidyltransferase domain-containing protein [Hydrogenobacter thermophilus]|uniref:nucleotidyltransferase family protein n=1 Tax=Hydrogenobacter thermophilus TaxID=940 RepID=UPI0011D12B8B
MGGHEQRFKKRGKKVKVYLFGSRVKGQNTPRSDLDLGFLSEEEIGYELFLLRELLEESNLPFSVDVVDLSRVGEEFRNLVLKEGKLWISF